MLFPSHQTVSNSTTESFPWTRGGRDPLTGVLGNNDPSDWLLIAEYRETLSEELA